MSAKNDKIPDALKENILMESADINDLKNEIKNEDIGLEIKGIDYSKEESIDMKATDLVKAMKSMGFQASNLGKACEVIDKMRSWRGEEYDDLPEDQRNGSFEIRRLQRKTKNNHFHGLYFQLDFLWYQRNFG